MLRAIPVEAIAPSVSTHESEGTGYAQTIGGDVTDGEALLRAITDQPDEDTPRLVYADYLDEHGQHDRAEFIRLQCQIAALAPSEDGHRLKVRANELLTRHEEPWLGSL